MNAIAIHRDNGRALDMSKAKSAVRHCQVCPCYGCNNTIRSFEKELEMGNVFDLIRRLLS
eukprot:5832476-Amphidinium_carterae.1